ncbi:unnamed protein product [Adineta steineri]|uniref:Uncharacterized protein n=1 Tax=Adineta steineri TaxID=433720 RepID=A0A819V332_9BILA|nr:unnamed protein product [Adineta steineri]CAF4101321.1 unnamed protein product [Adineta steineri]
MSIHSPPRRPIHYVDEEDKSDLFRLIWLDENCKKDHRYILQTKLILKEINNNCLFYDDLNQFRDHLDNNYFFETKTLLITSGCYFEKLLNDFHCDKPASLIIFCHNKKYEKYLNLPYVIGICTNYDSLKTSIERFLPSLKFHLYENHRLSTILLLKTTTYNNTNKLYSYILFIEILKQTLYKDEAKESMIKQVQSYYQNYSMQPSDIESFRKDYVPEDAIEWYKKETFVYRLVNEAFRTENSAMWYTFRFYISDLCKQMEEVHRKQDIQEHFVVYRGQSQVPKQEFENIISNCGGLISCNGALSTSKSFDVAYMFIADAKDTEDFHVVIFEITVDAKELKHTIFVDITQCSNTFLTEEEILFNIGTVFKIDSYEKEEEFWRIRMHATDECIVDIKERIEPIQKKLPTINVNLYFGKLLMDMNQYDKAELYFNMILKNLPELDHQDRPLIYEYLGDLQMHVKNYNDALKYFQKSYELKEKIYSKDDPNMFIIYNHLGNYYKAIDDIKTAQKYYKKTLNNKNNPINTAITKLNLATIFVFKKKYMSARKMCIDAREIFEQFQPIPYGNILVCQGILGNIYLKEERYDIAESFYLVAFEMGKKHLSIGDPCLMHCIYSLADLYHKQDKQTLALEFCKEQLIIHEKYLSNTKHICLAQILLKMGDLSNDISYYQKAIEIFNNNLGFDYLSTAKCLIKLAELDQNDQNIILYCQALKIYRKIYPPKHEILIETENELMKLKKIKKTGQHIVEENRLEQT